MGQVRHAHEQDFDWDTPLATASKMVGCHRSVRAEYLYFALDRQDFSGFASNGDRFRLNAEAAGHIIRGGLNNKF
jgi:hypothetical protein